MNIICLNGPPGSGKDTVGRMIAQMLGAGVVIDKFAAPLYEVANTLLKMDDAEYYEWREVRKEESLMTWPTTMRKLLIGISEDLIKPHMGKEYFGLQAAQRCVAEYKNYDDVEPTFFVKKDTIIFTDSGFQYEYDAFLDKVCKEIPDVKVHLAQVHRHGCTFDGDSREYVVDKWPLATYDIVNNSSLEHLEDVVIPSFLNAIGIKYETKR